MSDSRTSRRRHRTKDRSTATFGMSWPRPGLLGIALGEDVGGAGLDFVAACLVIEAAGRTAAYVPVVETMIYGAAPIAQFGTDEQKATWLPGVSSGPNDPDRRPGRTGGRSHPPRRHGAAHDRHGGSRRNLGPQRDQGLRARGLRGAGHPRPRHSCRADGTHGEVGVFIVDADTNGVTLTRQTTTTGRPEAIVELSGVTLAADRQIGGPGADGAAIVTFMTELGIAALCVLEAGACAAALELTAEYTKTRVQFDKPIATFQAVVSGRPMPTSTPRPSASPRGRLPHGSRRIAGGVRGGRGQVLGRRRWPARGARRGPPARWCGRGPRLPLHRYFLLTRQIELTLGGPTRVCAGSGGSWWPNPYSSWSARAGRTRR